MKLPALLLLAGIATCALPARAANESTAKPLSPEEARRSFEAAPGLEVELVAAEPLVASPCALAFDEQGRLFVAENRGYPTGVPEGQPGAGKIALLEDTDGDGRMDKRTVFAEGLDFPNGVLPWRGGLLVTASPDFLFLEDTDGDGRADKKTVLLTGFETAKSTQLRVNRPLLGPDGWIYLASGLSGGKITAPDRPDLPALTLNSDLRWHPETHAFEAVDGKSQFGQSFDATGHRFICMNRVQVQHVVLPSRYLKRNPLLPFSESVQNCPELIPNVLMRSTAGAARLYPLSANVTTADSHAGTFSAACAVTIWRGGNLPAEYQGAALSCDPTGNLVHADKLIPQGATFSAVPLLEKRELLAFRDDWARPVFLESGPDGALYVCDMYRKVIEHPDYLSAELRKHTDFESGKEMGRIWRVKSAGTPRTAALPATSVEKLVGALAGSAPGWTQETAFRLLAQTRPPEALPLLRQAFRTPPAGQEPSLAIFQMLHLYGALEAQDVELAFRSGRADLEENALQFAEENAAWQAIALQHVVKMLKAPRARFQLALSLPYLETPVLVAILEQAGDDRWTTAAALSASHGRTLPLLDYLQQTAPQYDAPGLLLAGRLIGAGKEVPDAATLVKQLSKFNGGRIRVLAGYCAATRAKLDPAQPALGDLLRQVEAVIQRGDSALAEDAVSLLAYYPYAAASGPLLQAAQQRQNLTVQQAAIRALASFDTPEVAATLLSKARWAASPPVERETTLTALLARPPHLSGILQAIESGAVPRSAIPSIRRTVFLKSKDEGVRARAEQLFAEAEGDRKQAYEKAKAALLLTPKPDHGREVFRALCATCHRLNQEGHAVGPDLFDIRNQPKENVLFHIAAPDAEIAPAFTAYQVELRDGRTLMGLLASETGTSITLRMPLAQEETILRSNLASLTALPNSLMPTGLESAIPQQDLADLLAYLKGER